MVFSLLEAYDILVIGRSSSVALTVVMTVPTLTCSEICTEQANGKNVDMYSLRRTLIVISVDTSISALPESHRTTNSCKRIVAVSTVWSESTFQHNFHIKFFMIVEKYIAKKSQLSDVLRTQYRYQRNCDNVKFTLKVFYNKIDSKYNLIFEKGLLNVKRVASIVSGHRICWTAYLATACVLQNVSLR